MRILWIDPLNTNPHFVNLMAILFHEAGHEVEVVSIAREGHPPPPEIRWTPFWRNAPVPPSLKSHPVTTLRLMTAYPLLWARAIRRARASGAKSLLLTSSLTLWPCDTWAIRRLNRLGLPSVVIVHKPYLRAFDDRSGHRAPRYRAFYASAAKVLTMCRFTGDLMQRLYDFPPERLAYFARPHSRPATTRSSVDAELAQRLDEWAGPAPVIAYFSGMRPEQGLDVLLDSLPSVAQEIEDWRLLLVSTGGARNEIASVERRLTESGYATRCWRQWKPCSPAHLRTYLAAASIVAAPYHQATQSSVLALAVGEGLPIVATDVGGLPEMVRPGTNGELTPPNNPTAFAHALVTVAANLPHYQNGAATFREESAPGKAAQVVADALRTAAHEAD